MLQDFHPAVVAFFDLDRTLIGKSSGELYIRTLKKQGRVSHRTLAKILAATALYGLNILSPEWLMERAASWYEGESEQEMIAFCRDFFHDTVKDYLYEEAVQRVREHQARGHTVALLTAATSYIAEPAGLFLGIPHLLCTRLDVQDGRFTGKLLKPICHGKGKLYWAIEFCKAHGAVLEESYFYTDSIRDLPALEAVGYPRPVNPDGALVRVARRRGWPVERFRETLGKV